MSFDVEVAKVLEREGGYSNNPADPGGETNFGISKRAYPAVDIKNLTRDEAIAIYRRDYWDKIKGEQLPPLIASVLFDAAVNQGIGQALALAQLALKLTPDRSLGPQTLSALQSAEPRTFLANFLAERALAYSTLKTFPVFGRGWYRRLFSQSIELSSQV